ncbi:TPA: ead/Ea22-like family protein [Klebsiella pneumoniae]|nr:ead/Ea22-like family protein [Klebsiella pneumoniae]
MTDITELAQSLKAAAEKASNGDWVKESGDGWEACCSANDQANGGFIIAHFVGPDAAENREFVQAANPANVLALVEALEKAQAENTAGVAGMAESYETTISMLRSRIAELESRTVKLPDFRHERFNSDWGEHDAEAYQVALREALTAAGIKVEAE